MRLGEQICIFLAFVVANCSSIHLTEEVWNNWEYLSLPEQLVYLLDDSELLSLKEEHDLLGRGTLEDMLAAHNEFQDPATTTAFFQSCDRDSDGHITFQELCICRGEHDRFGAPHDSSEWAARADAALEDFERVMSRSWSWSRGSDASIADEDGDGGGEYAHGSEFENVEDRPGVGVEVEGGGEHVGAGAGAGAGAVDNVGAATAENTGIPKWLLGEL